MRRPFSVLLVLLLTSPALSRELITRKAAQIHEKPDKKSKVLAEIAPNVKIDSDKTQDFWFRVSVEIDGRTVSGWVNQTDVTTMMGRSKGQLLAENRRLYDELVKLRQKTRVAQERLKGATEENANLRMDLDKAKAALDQVKAALDQARKEIERLKTAVKKNQNGRK